MYDFQIQLEKTLDDACASAVIEHSKIFRMEMAFWRETKKLRRLEFPTALCDFTILRQDKVECESVNRHETTDCEKRK